MRIAAVPALLVLLVSCSPKGFVFNGKKLPEVTITDMGDLYSTYRITEQEERQLTSQLKNAALVQEIKTYSQESYWPDAIKTLQKRIDARSTLSNYKFYKLAVLGTRTLVVVPPEKNRHMPQGFVPPTNMYMFFNARSVISKK
ncbi:MAG: hypothetical protein ACK4E8_08155 [Lacibacter sp.]|jgi:hypothetical protein